MNLLIDTGAMNCFALTGLVYALQLPVTDMDAPTAVTFPNGIKLHSRHTCITTVWFSPTCSRKIRFLVVDMKLPFVLGMEQ